MGTAMSYNQSWSNGKSLNNAIIFKDNSANSFKKKHNFYFFCRCYSTSQPFNPPDKTHKPRPRLWLVRGLENY